MSELLLPEGMTTTCLSGGTTVCGGDDVVEAALGRGVETVGDAAGKVVLGDAAVLLKTERGSVVAAAVLPVVGAVALVVGGTVELERLLGALVDVSP